MTYATPGRLQVRGKIEILGRRYEVVAISDNEVALKHLPEGPNGYEPILRLPLEWGDWKLKTK